MERTIKDCCTTSAPHGVIYCPHYRKSEREQGEKATGRKVISRGLGAFRVDMWGRGPSKLGHCTSDISNYTVVISVNLKILSWLSLSIRDLTVHMQYSARPTETIHPDKNCLYRKGEQLQYREYFADINRWQVYVETCQLSCQRSLGWTLASQAMCLAARKLLAKRLLTPSSPTNAYCFSNTTKLFRVD